MLKDSPCYTNLPFFLLVASARFFPDKRVIKKMID
jgi:hypothetical protein